MNRLLSLLSKFIFLSSEVTGDNLSETTNSIIAISEAISEYGPLIVIMAVFVIIFVLMVVLLLRNNAKMIDKLVNDKSGIGVSNQQMIEKFINAALENYKNDNKSHVENLVEDLKKTLNMSLNQHSNDSSNSNDNNDGDDYHKDIVGAYIDVNMAFKDASRKTLSILNCSRIGIYVFHNGNSSLHGLPFFKMSCIHEWTDHGCNTLRGKSHSDMPLHLFNDFIEDLWKNGVYKSQDVTKKKCEDTSLEEFVEFSHTKALYLMAIKDADGVLVGFVIAEFEDVDNFEEDTARDIFIRETLSNMVFNVSPFIANKYIFRRNQH